MMANNQYIAENRRLSFFIYMLFVGGILIIVYLGVTGNTPQTFNDVVAEYTAIDGSNKSAERNLYYLFAIAGAIFYGAYFFLAKENMWMKM